MIENAVRAATRAPSVHNTQPRRFVVTPPLSQPVEVPLTRAALRALLDASCHPQTVPRIGYGHPAGPTPRRPVSAVATFPVTDEVPS